MTISADTSGLSAYANRMRIQRGTVTVKAAAVISKGAYDVQRLAQQLAAVDTGAMKASIGVDFSADGLTAIVGPTVEYAPFVEHGTIRAAAQPFMRPAADAVLPGVHAALAQIMRRAAG